MLVFVWAHHGSTWDFFVMMERVDLLALLCVMFSCVFFTFQYGVLGQVCYLIVLIPDLCLLFSLSLTICEL